MGKPHHSKGEVVGVHGFSSRGIFLSYRREDAAPYARLLQYLFSEQIPDARIFMDLDSIEAGLDFAEVIREAVNSCAVLVALIGRQWATLSDEEGRRRLDNPDDYVRFEVQTALEREVRVIPVLVDGTTPLRQQQLPSELHKLARLNAFELSHARYQYDADRLVKLIQQVLAEASGTAPVNQSPPTAKAKVPAVPRAAPNEAPPPLKPAITPSVPESSATEESAAKSEPFDAPRHKLPAQAAPNAVAPTALTQYLSGETSITGQGFSVKLYYTRDPASFDVSDKEGSQVGVGVRELPEWAIRSLVSYYFGKSDVDDGSFDDDPYRWLENMIAAKGGVNSSESFMNRRVKVHGGPVRYADGPVRYRVSDEAGERDYTRLEDLPNPVKALVVEHLRKQEGDRVRQEREKRARERLDQMFGKRHDST